ncbi:MAG: hypothetical protein J6I85_00095 [Clostridia bacterium]|nr:hypothetical protein [Clostridia bacterium]
MERKNYLECSLTIDEIKEIKGIIWTIVLNFKHKISEEKNQMNELMDDIELIHNDTYNFDVLKLNIYNDGKISVITENQKTEIVNYLNNLMDEVCMFELKRALTFNEKLVFFFIYMEKLKAKETQYILQVSKKTIYNWQVSIDKKIKLIRGVF